MFVLVIIQAAVDMIGLRVQGASASNIRVWRLDTPRVQRRVPLVSGEWPQGNETHSLLFRLLENLEPSQEGHRIKSPPEGITGSRCAISASSAVSLMAPRV